MRAKPHFRYKARVWSCASADSFTWALVIGFGYTVREAWADWKRQQRGVA